MLAKTLFIKKVTICFLKIILQMSSVFSLVEYSWSLICFCIQTWDMKFWLKYEENLCIDM